MRELQILATSWPDRRNIDELARRKQVCRDLAMTHRNGLWFVVIEIGLALLLLVSGAGAASSGSELADAMERMDLGSPKPAVNPPADTQAARPSTPDYSDGGVKKQQP